MHYRKTFVLAVALFCVWRSDAKRSEKSFYTKLLQNPQNDYSCILIEESILPKYKGFETQDGNEIRVVSKPSQTTPDDLSVESYAASRVYEIFAKKPKVLEAHVATLCKTRESVNTAKNGRDVDKMDGKQSPEIVKLIDGGDQNNRIDVVFMGDGYTAEEREKFFDDMRRLTDDMFQGVTFRSYLPLFNIWAIFVPSVDSGIGYDGAKNTPFRLYREKGQLRVIWPGNEAYARQVCGLVGPNGCDYPSLIANDDFYGGLGGEFVISTKSARTGNIVLRHEMGHNFAAVGDEYDNSYAYWGVNSAKTLNAVGWTAWLTGELREERATYRLLEYPWHDLSTGGLTFNFTSDGAYSRWYLLLSVSAAGEADSLEFLLDGEILSWESRGFDDREFYDWHGTQGFSSGQHSFTVRSKTPSTHPEIPRMICSIVLHELGNESEFNEDNSVISAYPTWDDHKDKTLRPSNAACLMRNITHNEFCPVCKEGIWYQFLEKVSLIDRVTVTPLPNPDGTKRVILATLKLGQLRSPGNEIPGEKLEVRWTRGGQEQPEFQDMFEIDAPTGNWNVQVSFITPEVRVDPQGLLKESENFIV